MAEARTPTKEEIRSLPRWAGVAFAARCARRVQPVFEAAWPHALQPYAANLEKAIALVERTAARASFAEAAAAFQATVITLGVPSPDMPDSASDAAVKAAINAAHAAAHAADAAIAFATDRATAAEGDDLAAADHAAHAAIAAALAAELILNAGSPYAADAIGHVVDAARRASVPATAVRRDFDLLFAAARELGWTDYTPVPPEFFGPLWPEGEPEGWPAGERPAEPLDLVLEFEVPEDATREEVLQAAREVARHANLLHRTHGGKGLIIADIDIDVEASVREGVAQ
jgi:hypothetical protein